MLIRILYGSLFLLLIYPLAGQSVDWDEIITGKPAVYRKYNISTVESYNNDRLVRKIVCDKQNNKATFLNSNLDTLYAIVYDDRDRVSKIIRDGKEFLLQYFEGQDEVQRMSMSTNSLLLDTFRITSFPYGNRLDVKQNEVYVINRLNDDTLSKRISSYIINEEDSTGNYYLEIINANIVKRYNNQNRTSTSTTYYKGYYEQDSIIRLGGEKYHYYHSIIYPDSVIQTIRKDSTYVFRAVNNKLIHQKVSFSNRDAYEIFYNTDSSIKQRIVYTYLPTLFGDQILWEKAFYNGVGKKIKSTYPNKAYYKLKKGKLKSRVKKLPKKNLTMCAGATVIAIKYDYQLWMVSFSLFFCDTLEKYSVKNYPLKDRILNTLGNNILNDNDQLFYDEWILSYGTKDSIEHIVHMKAPLKTVAIVNRKQLLVLKGKT